MAAKPKSGLIAPGDVVEVRVFGQDSLSTKGRVRQDGELTLPLLGAVPVAGRAPDAVAQDLQQRWKPYVNSPEVNVVILASQVSIAIVGQVRQVGVVELEAPATVLHAIAKAGGMTDFADSSGIYVLRDFAGVRHRIRFRYDDLIDAVPAAISFQLRSGDVVIVE